MDGIEKDGDGMDEKMEIGKDGNGKDEKTEVEMDGDGKDEKAEVEKDGDGKDEKIKSTEKMLGEDNALGENWSKDDEIKKDEITIALSEQNVQPEGALDTDMREKSAVKTVMETAEEDKVVDAPTAGHDETPAGEETKPSSADGKAASLETAMPELPKVKYPQNLPLFLEPDCVAKVRNLPHINMIFRVLTLFLIRVSTGYSGDG